MNKTRNKILIAAGVVALIALILVFGPASSRKQEKKEESQATPTWNMAPKEIQVPDAGDENVPEEIAVPKVSEEKISDPGSKIRIFDIKAENNSFSPNLISINQFDAVTLRITAVDKDYDFTQPDYGLKKSIPKGETASLGFQGFAAGEFTFFCEICGGVESSAKGTVVVNPKEKE